MGAFGVGEFADSCMEERRAGGPPHATVHFALAHEACADSAESRCAGGSLRDELRLYIWDGGSRFVDMGLMVHGFMGHGGLYGTWGHTWDMGAYGIWRFCDAGSLDTGNDAQLQTSLRAPARRSSAR
jgi:hypothetical protein